MKNLKSILIIIINISIFSPCALRGEIIEKNPQKQYEILSIDSITGHEYAMKPMDSLTLDSIYSLAFPNIDSLRNTLAVPADTVYIYKIKALEVSTNDEYLVVSYTKNKNVTCDSSLIISIGNSYQLNIYDPNIIITTAIEGFGLFGHTFEKSGNIKGVRLCSNLDGLCILYD